MPNLTGIDQRIERLQQVKALLSDPEIASLIRSILLAEDDVKHRSSKNGVPINASDRSTQGRGAKARAIKQGISQTSGRFNIRILGVPVRSIHPGVTNGNLSRTLQWLAEKGELRIVKQGAPGGEPTMYEKTDKFGAV